MDDYEYNHEAVNELILAKVMHSEITSNEYNHEAVSFSQRSHRNNLMNTIMKQWILMILSFSQRSLKQN